MRRHRAAREKQSCSITTSGPVRRLPACRGEPCARCWPANEPDARLPSDVCDRLVQEIGAAGGEPWRVDGRGPLGFYFFLPAVSGENCSANPDQWPMQRPGMASVSALDPCRNAAGCRTLGQQPIVSGTTYIESAADEERSSLRRFAKLINDSRSLPVAAKRP